MIVSHYGFEQPRIEKKKLAHLLIHLVPCAIDKTEMVAAFPGEVLEVILISSVFNAEKNVLTSIFFNFDFVCILLSIKSKIKITL